ncbi:MAG TPA: TldD/PmbA family protein [Dongiaceae bacterium]|jgi:PmbA protein|nr:TldD/PmbA family protein [Dongiaceae bacterium]
MPDAKNADFPSLLEAAVGFAKAAGADAADAVIGRNLSLSVGERLGKLEKLTRSEDQDLGLRVFVGKRQAIVSTSDFNRAALEELAGRAVAMAKVVPEDPFCGLADASEITKAPLKLDILDSKEPSEAELTALVRAAEEAARAVKGVTNSQGAEAGWGRTEVAMLASNGFYGGYAQTHSGLSVSVLAGEGTGMETDYDYSSTVYFSDLADPAKLGRNAGERAVRRLNPRKVATEKVPIVFDPRVSGSMISHLLGAINGASIARGTSFLKDKMGEQIFAPGIDIVEDPHRPRGLRSMPFDGEGLATRRQALIEGGVLKTWILDCRSARQLGLKSTGNAQRGSSSPPSPGVSNVHMAKGRISRDALLKDIARGFYVTEMMGSAVNGVTGDYSRGASGFWIENGELAYPVSEVTIAGNLNDMFKAITAADDLEFRYGVNAPTLRIDGMTLAGA